MRVGDALQAIVGPRLIAIWGRLSCVEISQTRLLCLVGVEQEKQAQAVDSREDEAESGRVSTDGLNEAAQRERFLF